MPQFMESGGAGSRYVSPTGRLSRKRSAQERCEPRFRIHLRSGQISDIKGNLISDCLIHDRSVHGARVRLPVYVAVPNAIIFRDDDVPGWVRAEVRWRRNNEIGIWLNCGPSGLADKKTRAAPGAQGHRR